ncbi:UDP-3-O-[3-hydroxymyristoyl] N-acetylglucosamine deacetylase [bacterium (Candidatus Blackallbacteria) CG17_big_fil_post_rev_8_21_14_2_50_48_46]|uniref:UDP-3-O-acyl-N-acetylglucosamine deacetylase n=1 Tax=bacterium (Candidatus Blackallbacteria) CG17_big_fil_post_rev_8_21_14_2_50_48_46 TaxID=2014261 RepID=A0A2M7G391_9BACT|nr:MAG: UDP-3-O-[3-hydroxymyristoyl] N-acetylglucosamine deacetylase [bacterium (Candidatus Blackallbacteria) CG18_big_fil_WC_8_21_14_2_50_49_26]PIW16303.1 MAG: UDP-3-O-[3-hydroxymyristoyl] N-acetylglucosamine deacetylase [bacterium (Candidatus Blackallbacteria) CG17_big_fil_post_rev_8_21_14_2_50_48_46]PIW45317.1 MAG: UDP-3-O-[3-hydroxymyristoyl] N-acetylglucosamine deacetylase [bacterium (Candidatus Blackallbacteria) CG13_big_fil_rev_8_21_14_2_50_49_14]
MLSPDFQFDWTLAAECEFSGLGLHSGQFSKLRVLPSQTPGIFVLSENKPQRISVSQVTSTQYCTCLAFPDFQIQTVEHLLAALWGAGISSALLVLEGSEVPILDGSAQPFLERFIQVGRKQLPSLRAVFQPKAGQWGHQEAWIRWQPAEKLSLHYTVDYAGPPALQQSYDFEFEPLAFQQKIAPARTFVYRREVEALWQAGLAQGGSQENALVIEEQISQPDWRFQNEPVRHKILDLLGDLVLAGEFPLARIEAFRTGHQAHVTMVKLWSGS